LPRVVNYLNTNICKQKEIQSLDFLFLFHQGKRKAIEKLTQIRGLIKNNNFSIYNEKIEFNKQEEIKRMWVLLLNNSYTTIYFNRLKKVFYKSLFELI
jgi:hypothetical protein